MEQKNPDSLKDCMQAEGIYEALSSASSRALEELAALGLRKGMTQEELIGIMDGTSDETFSELANLGIFGPVLTIDQIMQICSGTDGDGGPNAYAALSVDTVTGEKDMGVTPYANISFGNPVVNVYAAGGCAVVTADFDRSNLFEYRRARNILEEWTTRKGDPEFRDKFLTLSLFPVATGGQLALMYHELVFAQGIPVENGGCRLIMAFDGNETQEIVDTGVRLDELKAMVDAEIARTEAEARMTEERGTGEGEKDEYNMAEQFVDDTYQKGILEDGEDGGATGDEEDGEGDGKVDWIRISK